MLTSNLVPKLPYLDIFRHEIEQHNATCEIIFFHICQNTMFRAKQKISNSGPKKPYLSIFGLKFEKTIAIFEISSLEFAIMQKFVQKKNILQFEKPLLYIKSVLSS